MLPGDHSPSLRWTLAALKLDVCSSTKSLSGLHPLQSKGVSICKELYTMLLISDIYFRIDESPFPFNVQAMVLSFKLDSWLWMTNIKLIKSIIPVGGMGSNTSICHISYHFPINPIFQGLCFWTGIFCLVYLVSKLRKAMSFSLLVIEKELFLITSVWFHLEILCLIMSSRQVY